MSKIKNESLKTFQMKENYNNNPQVEGEDKIQDCGCTNGSCKPKKKNNFSKLIFAVIILTALAIIGVKLVGHSVNASGKQLFAAPGKPSCCDTSNTKTCDTTKGSSCCSKK
jgi:hypothetical protein